MLDTIEELRDKETDTLFLIPLSDGFTQTKIDHPLVPLVQVGFESSKSPDIDDIIA